MKQKIIPITRKAPKGEAFHAPLEALSRIKDYRRGAILKTLDVIPNIKKAGEYQAGDGSVHHVMVVDETQPIPENYKLPNWFVDMINDIRAYPGDGMNRRPFAFSEMVYKHAKELGYTGDELENFHKGFAETSFIEDYLRLIVTCDKADIILPDFKYEDYGINEHGKIVFTNIDDMFVKNPELPVLPRNDITDYVLGLNIPEKIEIFSDLDASLKEIGKENPDLEVLLRNNVSDINHELGTMTCIIPGDEKKVVQVSNMRSKSSFNGDERGPVRSDPYIMNVLSNIMPDQTPDQYANGQINGVGISIMEATRPLNTQGVLIGNLDKAVYKSVRDLRLFAREAHHLSSREELRNDDGTPDVDAIAKYIHRMFIMECHVNNVMPDYIEGVADLKAPLFVDLFHMIKDIEQAGFSAQNLTLSNLGINREGDVVLRDAGNLTFTPGLHEMTNLRDINSDITSVYEKELKAMHRHDPEPAF